MANKRKKKEAIATTIACTSAGRELKQRRRSSAGRRLATTCKDVRRKGLEEKRRIANLKGEALGAHRHKMLMYNVKRVANEWKRKHAKKHGK